MRSVDAFRTLPADLTNPSSFGGVLTVAFAVAAAYIVVAEVAAYTRTATFTDMEIDSNSDQLLRINFDVHFFDLSCDYLSIGVRDSFGTDRLNVTRDIVRQRVDHGGEGGKEVAHKPYTDDELVELELQGREGLTKEQQAEVDADWESTSDTFRHSDFANVLMAHDFTFVLFYVDWCPACVRVKPAWNQFEELVNQDKGEREWGSLGHYNVTRDKVIGVTTGVDIQSHMFRTLTNGKIVNVLEVVNRSEDKRLRGRIDHRDFKFTSADSANIKLNVTDVYEARDGQGRWYPVNFTSRDGDKFSAVVDNGWFFTTLPGIDIDNIRPASAWVSLENVENGQRYLRLADPDGLYADDSFRVNVDLVTDDDARSHIPKGTWGVVKKLDDDGDALVTFDTKKEGWIHKANFSKLDRIAAVLRSTRDADGRAPALRALRVNCEEFRKVCVDQGVFSYPTMSLYRRSVTGPSRESKTDFDGRRTVGGLARFLQEQAAQRHLRTGARYHDVFREGCRVRGSVEVARVPGALHFDPRPFSEAHDASINPAFTNVSHRVHHLSFGTHALDAARDGAVYVTIARAAGAPVGIRFKNMVVTSVKAGSPAERAEVQVGWQIVEVARRPVYSSDAFVAACKAAGTEFQIGFRPATAAPSAALAYAGRDAVAPIDGRIFVTERFHQAPQHYIKVVSTRAGDGALWGDAGRVYAMTHQHHVAQVPTSRPPQARFHYDLSPVEVVMTREREQTWHGCFTSLLAVIGGMFSTMHIFARSGKAVARSVRPRRQRGSTMPDQLPG